MFFVWPVNGTQKAWKCLQLSIRAGAAVSCPLRLCCRSAHALEKLQARQAVAEHVINVPQADPSAILAEAFVEKQRLAFSFVISGLVVFRRSQRHAFVAHAHGR